jgi:hypothetical protein
LSERDFLNLFEKTAARLRVCKNKSMPFLFKTFSKTAFC